MLDAARVRRIGELVAQAKPLAAEYYRLTGKPLGITGEIAEVLAAKLLNLELASARTSGFDAIRRYGAVVEKIQIKGRALDTNPKSGQRLGTIKRDADCDVVMLVLMNNTTLDVFEIWEASMADVRALLDETDSKARQRGSLAIVTYKRKARCVWSR